MTSMDVTLNNSTTKMPPLESKHSLASHGSNDSNGKNLCVVCDDESDGLHFGQHTCRACAAFFRRTVSLKLDYVCKHENNCEIVKTARNMCRSCRYQKCLQKGMLTTAVQHSRDGLGKRKEAIKRPAPESQPSTSAPSTCSTTSDYSTDTSNNNMWSPQNQQTSPTTTPSSTDLTAYNPNYIYTTTNGIIHGTPVIHTFSQMQLSNNYVPIPQEMKVLQKMVEGYRNFLSLRRASYTLVDVIPRFSTGDPDTIPQSNYGTSKKSCRIEASLVMDVANNYFQPFSMLQSDDKIKLFDTFYCHFSTAERAYNSFRRFGHIEGNDKLIMPDGGYVELSQLSKFYENSAKGDPEQLAQ
uniref:Nuclear receptor domain-containing protein n=1 Tax=Panagrolaimus sp. PS1159 TaxID=55785 RepID=A0AC35FEC5_9BILA